MAATTNEPAGGSRFSSATSWIAIALVAIVAGLVLPQFGPGEPVANPPPAKADSKDKTNLGYAPPAMPEAPNLQGMMVRLGVGTVIVLALCVASLWVMRRWMTQPITAASGDRLMQLTETLDLGNQCSLHLVHMGKREILVGADCTGIKVVLPMPDAFEELLGPEPEPAPEPGSAQPTKPPV
ncbi:MAG: flagellar biosynthetic protein FliO [Planctomycetes bacterium]|nr:flagellar biosynthetic protein FliO [Planctomycetota bacterium]